MEHLGQGLLLPFHFCLNFLNFYGQNETFSLFQNYFSSSSSSRKLEWKNLISRSLPQAMNTSTWLLLMQLAQLTLDFLSISWGCQQKFSTCIYKNTYTSTIFYKNAVRKSSSQEWTLKTELEIACKHPQFKGWVPYFHAEQLAWSQPFSLSASGKHRKFPCS